MPREWNAEVIADRLARIELRLQLRQSRAAECRRILLWGVERLKGSGVLDQPEEVQSFALALQDGLLILDAFDGLMEPAELPGAADRLRAALGGTSIMVPERDSDPERDALWELSLVGIFRSNGVAPQFGDDVMPGTKKKSVRRPDIFVAASGLSLGVEAKRARSRQRLGERVATAVKQIASACTLGHAQAGFLAIDVSFATERHAQHGLWTVPDATAKQRVRDALVPELVKLQEEIYETVQAQPGAEHVVGAVTLVMPVLRLADARQLSLVRYFTRAPYEPGRDDEAIAAFKEVAGRCFADAR